MASPRNIMIYSVVFRPMIGGIETISDLIAQGLSEQHLSVRLVTPINSDQKDHFPYIVIRTKSILRLIHSIWNTDVLVISGMSFLPVLFGVLCRKKTIVIHHTWLRRVTGELSLVDQIKRYVIKFVNNIAVSKAVATDLPVHAYVIENCYNDVIFKRTNVIRNKDVIFAGRLVSDKGADILFEAISRLVDRGTPLGLTIAGSGPEEPALRAQAAALKIDGQVSFVGALDQTALADAFAQHQIAAFPSRWLEPFGVVALEAAACGCAIIGSSGGGLTDAIGPCGTVVPNGDINALADAIDFHMKNARPHSATCTDHLERHTVKRVLNEYLALML